jgi:hypothetical protein
MPRIAPFGSVAALGLACTLSSAAHAAVLVGAGGRGVPIRTEPGGVGSDLIGVLDYSDTFTGNEDGGLVPDRAYSGLRAQSAYMVENTYGNPEVQLTQRRTNDTVSPPRPFMSFAADKEGRPGISATAATPYPGTSGAGSDTGFTQAGGGFDYGIPYALRDEYVVQFDAMQSNDRIDITSGENVGTIGLGNLSVFFRGPQWAGNATHGNNLSLYNGTTDTPLRGQPGFENLSTGLSDSPRQWHNYAVRFDTVDQEIEIFVDEVSMGVVDLNTFAGGIYAGFTNTAVNVGGPSERLWTDNFQVGAPVPEPAALALLAAPCLALLRRRRR